MLGSNFIKSIIWISLIQDIYIYIWGSSKYNKLTVLIFTAHEKKLGIEILKFY